MTFFAIFIPLVLAVLLAMLVFAEKFVDSFDQDSLEEWEAFGDAIERNR